jgi:hypothetical protein
MSNEPTNTAVDIANKAAKILVMDVLLEGAVALALVEVPWLNAPVVKQMFTFMMNFCAKFILKKLTIETAMIIIGVQVGQQQHDYEVEIEQLKTAIKEGKSDEEIAKERAEAKERLRKLINYNAG